MFSYFVEAHWECLFGKVGELKNWLFLKNKMRLNSHDIRLGAVQFLSLSKTPSVLKDWRKLMI
jgi:hypothetical protein